MAEPHPDWPPICLDMIKVLLAGEVRREDIETARRFMRDLEGHETLLASARHHEAAAIERMPKAQRVAAMQRGSAPVPRQQVRPSPLPAPPPPAAVAGQGALW